jgi:O-antigen ligase
MGQTFYLLLGFMAIAIFMALMLFWRGDRNKMYLIYILLLFPFSALNYFPSFISPNLFDYVTILFIILFYTPRKGSFKYGKLYLSIFILLTIVSLIGILNAETLSKDTLTSLVQYFTIFGFAKILIDECIADERFFYTVLGALKIPLIISLLFLVGQFIYGPGFTFERTQNSNVLSGMTTRFPGFFQDPQKFAQFLAMSSLLLLVKEKGKNTVSVFNMILLVISVIALLFTGGRAGFGGWAAGVFILVLLGSRQYKFAVIAACTVLFIVIYNYADEFPMFNRLSSLGDDYDFRFSIWQDAFGIFKDNPVFGIGMGNYANYVSVHNPDQVWYADNSFSYFDHPESGYLKFLTEFGITGFIAVISLIFMPVFKGFRTFLKSGETNILILIAVIISWLVGFYTLYSIDDGRIKILIVTVICLLITSNKWNESDVKE